VGMQHLIAELMNKSLPGVNIKNVVILP
jgi:hypothetical protein